MTPDESVTGESAPLPFSGAAALSVECMRGREALYALAPTWRRLLDDSTLKSAFLIWEWQRAWLDHYLAPDDEPRVLVVRQGDTITGIAPFLLQQEPKPGGRRALRRLRFLGTGEPEPEEVLSEAMDVICLPGREAEVAAAVAGYLLEHAPEWDVLYFQDIRRDSLIRRQLLPRLR